MSKHLKIALVDDDIPNTEILRDFLIRNGYSHVDKYHDGETFLDSLDRFKFSIIAGILFYLTVNFNARIKDKLSMI